MVQAQQAQQQPARELLSGDQLWCSSPALQSRVREGWGARTRQCWCGPPGDPRALGTHAVHSCSRRVPSDSRWRPPPRAPLAPARVAAATSAKAVPATLMGRRAPARSGRMARAWESIDMGMSRDPPKFHDLGPTCAPTRPRRRAPRFVGTVRTVVPLALTAPLDRFREKLKSERLRPWCQGLSSTHL
jgi:hypothetical protein